VKNEIEGSITDSKLNKYALDKFYSNRGIIIRDNILKNKTKYDFVYSNINLKIK